MDANAQVFGHKGSASRAYLRGVFGRDFDDLPGNSFFRFLPENREESEPTGVPHRFIERAPSMPRFHFFDVDGVVAFKQMVRGFKLEVPSLVGNLGVGLGFKNPSFVPAVGALLPPILPSLAHRKQLFGPFKEPGIFDHLSVAGSEEGFATHINPNFLAGQGQGSSQHIVAGKGNEPTTDGSSANGDRLNRSFDGTRKSDFKSTNFFDDQMLTLKFPSSSFKGERIVTVPTFKPGKAWLMTSRLPNFSPTEKVLIRFIQSLKCFLERPRTHFFKFGKFFFQGRKFFVLGKSGNGNSVPSVGGDPLLQGSIVQPTAKIKPALGPPNGLGISFDRIFKGFFHMLAQPKCQPNDQVLPLTRATENLQEW